MSESPPPHPRSHTFPHKPDLCHSVLRETLGISADGSQKAYRADDIDAFLTRTPLKIPYDPANPHTVVLPGSKPGPFH